MRKFTVLTNENLIEFEVDPEKIKTLLDKGFNVSGHVLALSLADARVKYENMSLDSSAETKSKPSGYLTIMSRVFLTLGLMSSLLLAIRGMGMIKHDYLSQSRDMGMFFIISSVMGFISTLLIHSACRCLVYITDKQS
ncbi:hypothetical protein K0W35_003525 [Vibrio parahaemolyticus]|nr:hypothetical protein [Vibrio parahaemolyticus]